MGTFRWHRLTGGSASLGTGFESKSLIIPLPDPSLCFRIAFEDVSSQYPGLAARPPLAATFPAMIDSYPSGTLSPNKLLLLYTSLIMVFNHEK